MMRTTITVLTILSLSGVILAAPVDTSDITDNRETRVYQHPSLDLRITAPVGWDVQPRPEDDLIHEIADPVTDIHAVLWYTATEQSARDYLRKMAHMKDVEADDREPEVCWVYGHKGWHYRIPGRVADKPVHAILAVIPGGTDRAHPDHNALYVVELHCPAADRDRLEPLMLEILHSVKIMTRVGLGDALFPLYPRPMTGPCRIDSPIVDEDGMEYVTVLTRAGERSLVPVTVENGTPAEYPRNLWGKGRQLAVDAEDFPTLAHTGLHDPAELANCRTITGRTLADLTADGRPGGLSSAGFLAVDEDILSVIRGDDALVQELGLDHTQLARPLFHVFNVVQRNVELFARGDASFGDIESIIWGEHRVRIEGIGGKGWQVPLFDDEVHGNYHLIMERELTGAEDSYLDEHYAHLDAAARADLEQGMTRIHTGEMVPFMIRRYGFYEGHTDYRADPVAIAFIFGLMNLEEIDRALDGNLDAVLTRHYTVD